MTKLIPAVAYVRMSTDKQDKSPARQRADIEPYAAKRGYEIIEWYTDEGISGDNTEKRLAFKKMCADGALGMFKVIVCEDLDRFGRFDSNEAGYWIYPLRQNGISIDTVTEGTVDLESMTGRIMNTIKIEGKHAYLTDLSGKIASAHNKTKLAGKVTTGRPPFGYAIDETRTLIPGDPDKVRTLEGIFSQYAAGHSLREIALWLNNTGVATQLGKTWSARSVSLILANERYLGHMVYNQFSTSKYRDPGNPKGKTIPKPRDEWLIKKNTHQPLVDLATWDAVQKRRASNSKQFSGPRNKNQYALRGMLFCENCGGPMCGHSNRAGKIHYQCNKYNSHPEVCERRTADELEILRNVLRVIREQVIDKYFGPAQMAHIKEAMREKIKARDGSANNSRTRTADRIIKLDHDIETATVRLITIAPDIQPLIEKKIRVWQSERAELADHLAKKDAPPAQQLAVALSRVDAMVGWLGRLDELADSENYDAVKIARLLPTFVPRVGVSIDPQEIEGSRYKRQTLVGGSVYFSLENFPEWVIPASENLLPLHVSQT